MISLSNKKKVTLLGATLLLIFFHYLGWLSWVENGVRSAVRPISASFYKVQVGINQRLENRKKKNELESIYQKYQEQQQASELQKTQIQSLKDENEKLKQLANFKGTTSYDMVTAQVVGKNSNITDKMVIIDAGQKQGIKSGMAVISGGGILVGRINSTEKNTSMVRLINDNQSKFAASIINKEKSMGVVEGGYGLSVKMNLIPRNEVVMIGDKVITSGLETSIPRGLLIGEVAVSENEAFKPFQQAILTPAAELEKLDIVGVLISSN